MNKNMVIVCVNAYIKNYAQPFKFGLKILSSAKSRSNALRGRLID